MAVPKPKTAMNTATASPSQKPIRRVMMLAREQKQQKQKRQHYSLKFVLHIAIFSFFLGCYLNNLVHWTQDAGRTTLYHHDHKYNHDAPFLNISSSNNNNNNNATATTSTSTISTTKERLWQRLQQLLDDGAKLLNDTTTTTTTEQQQQQQHQQVAEQAEATTTTTNTAETSIHKSTHPPKQVQVLGTTSESQQQQQQPPPSPKKKKKHAPPQTTKQTNDIDNDANNDNKDHDDKPKIRPMNIVLLYADDWSYKTLGKVNPFVQTPNLDQLADKGLLFTHNCVTTSVCWMSRATLLTGQYVSTHGILKPPQGSFFETWNQTLWQQLADAGYYNGFFGKWHNSMVRPDLIDTAMHDHDFYFGRHWETPTKHVTVKNYEHGMRFLKRKQWGERPFFLTISFFATHAMDTSKEQYYPQPESMSLYANDNDTVPMPQQYNTGNGNTNTNTTNAESSWQRMPYFFGERNEGRRRFQRRYQTNDLYQTMMKNMYRMATEVDTACGKIIDELERQNLLPHTMVIFTTDNGNYHSEHGLADKWFPHDESIRVPLIVWDPRMPASQAGTTNDEFTLNVDLAPTILSAAGVTPPSTMQGDDFSKLYLLQEKKNTTTTTTTTTKKWRDEFFYEWPSTFQSYYLPKAEALVRKDYKYLYWSQYDYHQLFHVAEDPMEEVDLVNETSVAGVLVAMKARFNELQAEVTK